MATAHINRIGTAVPPHDVHEPFVRFVEGFMTERRDQMIFKRMVSRSGNRAAFFVFRTRHRPRRLRGRYRRLLHAGQLPRHRCTHGTLRKDRPRSWQCRHSTHSTSTASASASRIWWWHRVPAISRRASISSSSRPPGSTPGVERTAVGFMGCYAAVNSLRLAHHFVRSEPHARVLVVNLELCTLHFQQTGNIEQILSMLLFGDGCSATLVTADETGIALKDFRAHHDRGFERGDHLAHRRPGLRHASVG